MTTVVSTPRLEAIAESMGKFVREYVAMHAQEPVSFERRTVLTLEAIVRICARLEHMLLDEPSAPVPDPALAPPIESI